MVFNGRVIIVKGSELKQIITYMRDAEKGVLTQTGQDYLISFGVIPIDSKLEEINQTPVIP